MRFPWGGIIAALIAVLLLGTAIVAEYTNMIPCSVFSHSSIKDVPARCIKNYVP